MKSKFKYAIWGAAIFGGIHLILAGYCMKAGGDTAMAIIFIDYPLYILGGLIGKIFPHINEIVVKDIYYQIFGLTYYLGLGTMLYCLFGSVVGIFIYRIKKV